MRRNVVFALIIAFVFVSAAVPATWVIDTSHSSADFKVRHLAISNVRGTFPAVQGTIEWNEQDVTQSTVEATIDIASVDTGEPKRDAHLVSADFFDAETHPTMTFKSKKVEKSGDGLKVTGDLTLRGVTKEVVLDVEGPYEPIKDPWGNVKTGATATTTINRQDFGVSWNKTLDTGGLVVGNDVHITLELEIMKQQ